MHTKTIDEIGDDLREAREAVAVARRAYDDGPPERKQILLAALARASKTEKAVVRRYNEVATPALASPPAHAPSRNRWPCVKRTKKPVASYPEGVDDETLRRLYCHDGLTAREIGERYSISTTAAYTLLKNAGVQTRSSGPVPRETSRNQDSPVYILIDPRDGTPRYVGTSVDPEQRLRNHVSDAKNGVRNNELSVWIRELLSKGLRPELKVIARSGGMQEEARVAVKLRQTGAMLLNASL